MSNDTNRKYGFGGTAKEQPTALEAAGFPPEHCIEEAPTNAKPAEKKKATEGGDSK